MSDAKITAPSEQVEQISLMRWAECQKGAHPELKLLLHIPNGGARAKAEAGKFKAMGVKAGVPDLFLPVARGTYHGLWIELKRADGGKTQAAQRGWIDALREQGYMAGVAHGWVEAAEKIMEYLDIKA